MSTFAFYVGVYVLTTACWKLHCNFLLVLSDMPSRLLYNLLLYQVQGRSTKNLLQAAGSHLPPPAPAGGLHINYDVSTPRLVRVKSYNGVFYHAGAST